MSFRGLLRDRYTKQRMVYDLVTNGAFATDTGWAKDAEWAIASGVAAFTGAGGGAANIQQDVSAVAGTRYRVTFDFVVVSGAPSVSVSIGGTTHETPITASGQFEEEIVATTTGNLIIAATGDASDDATIDNVVVEAIGAGGKREGVLTTVGTGIRCRLDETGGKELFVKSADVIADGMLFCLPDDDLKETDVIQITDRGGIALTAAQVFFLNPLVVKKIAAKKKAHHIEAPVLRIKNPS